MGLRRAPIAAPRPGARTVADETREPWMVAQCGKAAFAPSASRGSM